MKCLLDTHTFLWWHDAPERLLPAVLDACLSLANALLLSVVSLWEIQIKMQTGKLILARSLRAMVDLQIGTNTLGILPVEPTHIWELDNLPLLHKDPFDRLLIAQACAENATLLSLDASVAQYPVNRLW